MRSNDEWQALVAEYATEVRRIATDVTNDPATADCLSELADRMEGVES